MFGKQTRSGITTFSSFPHRLSAADTLLLIRLNLTDSTFNSSAVASPPTVSDIPSRKCTVTPTKLWFLCTRKRNAEIRPSSSSLVRPELPQPVDSEELTLLRYSLETFFTIECLVVTSYLEAVVPIFYTAYILVMVHLPSAQYHSEMAGVNQKNVGSTVLPVFVFGMLQIVSLVLLVVILKRNCGMKALYQLAFVLETHMWSIVSKLMVWMMITLCFRVVHFGVDFSFKFTNLGW
ncbi:hypothetical protein PR001_g17014 [Phytophthora rubi]|uniref:Uncharacterized protein n=1 Tax=Phytophthora rubi TaxID=129364 RepID=A0A6A3KPX5_9STRA|nr:hypothetical protein PR001_g17014 [Phytophthora rubi]